MQNVSILMAVDPVIPAVGEIAGARFNVRVASFEGFVSFPLDDGFARSNESSKSHDHWPSFAHHDAYPNPSTAAASVGGSVFVVPGPKQLNVRALHFEISEIPDETEAAWNISEFNDSLRDWMRIFRSWIGQWTQLPQSDTSESSLGVTKFLMEKNGVTVPHFLDGTFPTLFVGYELASESMFSAAVRAASAGIEVAPELQMLARAHLGLMRRDYRGSIIDSCSAAEMSIIQWLTNTFTVRYDASTAKKLSDRLNGVAALFKVYFASNGSQVTFKEVFEQLARPRNKALHNGEKFSGDESDKAFKIAKRLISETAPMLMPKDVLAAISS